MITFKAFCETRDESRLGRFRFLFPRFELCIENWSNRIGKLLRSPSFCREPSSLLSFESTATLRARETSCVMFLTLLKLLRRTLFRADLLDRSESLWTTILPDLYFFECTSAELKRSTRSNLPCQSASGSPRYFSPSTSAPAETSSCRYFERVFRLRLARSRNGSHLACSGPCRRDRHRL